MLVVGKQLRCLMFRSDQIGIPLHSRGPDPNPLKLVGGLLMTSGGFGSGLELPPLLCLT